MHKFDSIYLLHGKGGSPEGSVLKLQDALQSIPRSSFKHTEFKRLRMAHAAANVRAEESFAQATSEYAPYFRTGSLVIGISMGGLIAAKIQEASRPDLHVIAISSPTGADNLRLDQKMENRVALYSSRDPFIQGRTSTWPLLAEAYDLMWLTHDTDDHRYSLALLINTYVNEGDLKGEAAQLWAPEPV